MINITAFPSGNEPRYGTQSRGVYHLMFDSLNELTGVNLTVQAFGLPISIICEPGSVAVSKHLDKISMLGSDSKWDLPDTEPIVIFEQPVDVEMIEGDTTQSVSVLAHSNGDLHTTQWYSVATDTNTGGSAISGAIDADYDIPDDTAVGTHYFYAVITAGSSTLASDPVTVVVAAPVITIGAQPQDAGVTAGAITGNLAVTATADSVLSITHQWQAELESIWTDIEGATAATLAIPTDLTVGTYNYRVVLTCGSTTENSDAATVTVSGGE